MMKTIKILLIAMIAIAGPCITPRLALARATSEEWQQLGTHVVDYSLDYDVIAGDL
jgi:hypothetical protein